MNPEKYIPGDINKNQDQAGDQEKPAYSESQKPESAEIDKIQPEPDDEKQIESIRERIFRDDGKRGKREISLIEARRYPKNVNPGQVPVNEGQKIAISQAANDAEKNLRQNYLPGLGIMPSANPKDNFYKQVWTRDLSQGSGSYFDRANPQAVKDSLETVFSHQRADGALPFRVEQEYMLVKLFPGLRSLARPAFVVIEEWIRRRKERPVYEGQDFSSSEDTIPAALISAGEFFLTSQEGQNFGQENYEKIKKAAEFFGQRADQEDGLIEVRAKNPDWADSIIRGGKIGTINIWWARSLRLLSFMAQELGFKEDAAQYRGQFETVKKSIIEKLYNQEEGYFRASAGEDRIDAAASVFGALYLLEPTEAVKVEETLKQRLMTNSGLKNFDPPYPSEQIMWPHKLINLPGYHNEYVWPWVTCQNIEVKIKIATSHPDEAVRGQYKEEAVADLANMAQMFNEAGGAYEIFDPETRRPPNKRFYHPPQNLMGGLAAYEGAYLRIKELGWIE